eukprot:TRINITY_DN10763_c0_g6_i1.p1 TRINITY_DN10763_c0_g6~~TRINITY_DN10763_c0_g6_i1.p1  ORF type:complete len:2393 (+),score=568.77 TRINITY_DN10763_c0_g6_i1:803-7180(+)
MANEARLVLRTRLRRKTKYSVTIKLKLPSGRNLASQNSYDLKIEYYQMKVIEGVMAPVDITYTIPNAKDEVAYGRDYSLRGYITALLWQPRNAYRSSPGALSTYTFGFKTFGEMGKANLEYVIDVVAYPTNVWRMQKHPDYLAPPGEDCGLSCTVPNVVCEFRSFSGAPATEANGFRIKIGSAPFVNRGSQNPTGIFELTLYNPMVSANMYWTATSMRLDNDKLPTEPYTVFLDKPIAITGEPQGLAARWELAAINVEQWITLEFTPGNTLMPDKLYSGFLVIVPPAGFEIVVSSAPQDPSLKYNPLPCSSWPVQDRTLGRWACPLQDQALFKHTLYRVMLKVINPAVSGAALSWRTEVWQADASKPIAVTRSLRGMPVSGRMRASLAQENQLLGGVNRLRIDFTPSQDAGKMPNTALQVVAPPGFLIIKRCKGFTRVELPPAICEGSDRNSFRIVFPESDAIKRDNTYIFEIEVDNPKQNLPDEDNYWTFDTTRPDGVSRDTARFQGFFLYPLLFSSFKVIPLSRKVGPRFVVLRFISPNRIPFDDFLRIRAPLGTRWHSDDLGFATSNEETDAYTFETRAPTVIFETPNVLLFQLRTTCEALFEYGIKARIVVPQATPVPNRWWIEQFRQTGNPAPNNWQYVASFGGDGFKTQVLINTKVEPFNVVKEAWQNPTLIVFEGTVTTMPQTDTTALGIVPVHPEFQLVAPPGFTFICPITETVYMPPYTTPLPDDAICKVDHNNDAERNKLHVKFPRGIKADTRYAFTIDLVNGPYIDPITNFFTLQTRIRDEVVEDAIVPGFLLADRMDNTRYYPLPRFEDRVVNAKSNMLTFLIGTVPEATEAFNIPTTLEVIAPVGFKFAFDCTDRVGPATWMKAVADQELPEVEICQNLERENAAWANRAHIQLKPKWGFGAHAIFVRVENPTFTPKRNFWGLTIMDRDRKPLMSESWVYGFEIQVVLNPTIYAYNPGRTIARESAINYVDVSFDLTTPLPPDGVDKNEQCKIKVTAPAGYRFPNVCRSFTADTKQPGKLPLPKATTCKGNNDRTLTLTLPQYYGMEAKKTYAFRFLVLNPSETYANGSDPKRWWRIETTLPDDGIIDLNYQLHSFELHERLGYFVVDTLSRVGYNSTIFRFHLRTTYALPPQSTVHIFPPLGTKFYGTPDGGCLDEDPMITMKLFPVPLISGVTRMPEWMDCRVKSPTEIELKNTEPFLGGRPLIAGPVFEFFVENVTNAERTPDLNIFRVVAKTMAPLGQEVWKADGWIIFPELTLTRVESTNPGFGLYTTFKFRLKTITEVPERGYINITGPDDYYFGPQITDEVTQYNPLKATPPPQGMSPERPPASESTICLVLREPEDWVCPFDFITCRGYAALKELEDIGMTLPPNQVAVMNQNKKRCDSFQAKCAKGGNLRQLIKCVSKGPSLELFLETGVVLPSYTTFTFNIQGYNARQNKVNLQANTWYFQTIYSDSQRTVLDKKGGVPGLSLIGIVAVPSLIPSETKVGSIENYATITIILTFACPPKALLRIVVPDEYRRNANAAFQGSPISTGDSFPTQVEKRQTMNTFELETIEEQLAANTPMQITIGLSNGPISPSREANVWKIEAFTLADGAPKLLNCNYDVEGFKIFGEFAVTAISPSVMSPNANNIIGAWFMLKSILKADPTSRLKIVLPKGYKAMVDCGSKDPNRWSLSYNPNRPGVKEPHPPEKSYFPLPSGTYCYDKYDPVEERYYVLLEIDVVGMLDYGLDYAFEFLVINPAIADEPSDEDNYWRFETMRNGVILHLSQEVRGFRLEQIKEVRVTPSDTTTLFPLNRIEFHMMSDKTIPGGSKIFIYAPSGFTFLCAFFRTIGLVNTLCYVKKPNLAEFTLDSQDRKDPDQPFKLLVYLTNPEFTPQINEWAFDIVAPANLGARKIDTRSFLPSFDITGRVLVEVKDTFPYIGETNPLRIVFVQSTIMNQADNGNEIVVLAPQGYVFPINCTGFYLRLSNEKNRGEDDEDEDDGMPKYPESYTYPPPGITCQGFNNRTVVIRMPDGVGLLRNNYTLEVDVENPPYLPNTTNEWQFITRVRNEKVGQKIVDANRTVPGFVLEKLIPLRTVEGDAAPPRSSVLAVLALAVTAALAGARALPA